MSSAFVGPEDVSTVVLRGFVGGFSQEAMRAGG